MNLNNVLNSKWKANLKDITRTKFFYTYISRKLIIQEFKVRYKELNFLLKKAIFTYIHNSIPSIGIPVLFSSGTKQFLFPTFLSRVT